MLDEFEALTGYVRCYASYLLRNHGRKISVNNNTLVIGDVSFFQPVMKMIEKTRTGSKVKKKYDKPQTPYQRVLQSPHVSKEEKERFKRQYALLNPAELKRQITRLQNKLMELVSLKETARKQNLRPNRNNGRKHKDIEYAFCEVINASVADLQYEDTHFRGY